MKTETSSVEKSRERLRNGEKAIRKRNLCGRRATRRNNRTHNKVPTAVQIQKLFETCRRVFKGAGTVPPPGDVQKLQRILDKLKPEDVGLSGDLPFFRSDVVERNPTIKYTTIYKGKNFSMFIFFLPPAAVIPLHNHPGMTVFSKLLLGSMHIKAYDWVDPAKSDGTVSSSQLRLARLEVDSVFTAPCRTSILYPAAGGNIHTFTAVTPCVVLDVLGPPYSIEEDRDCTYYREFPYTCFSDNTTEITEGKCSCGWLEAIEMPKDLKMDRVEYPGPQIVEACYC